MKASERPAAAVEVPAWRDQITVALMTVATITVAGDLIVSAMSYQHEYELARHNQQAPWVSSLFPFSVDGMLFVAGVGLLWAAVYGVRGWGRLWQPRAVLAVGALATIAANLFSDRHYWWLGPAVSASAGVSLVLMSAVAFWLAAEQRRIARGEPSRPASACSCPPPPVTLAEALPLARGRLQEMGERFGEEALADRFGVKRHQVRLALAAAERDQGGKSAVAPAARSEAPALVTQNAPAGVLAPSGANAQAPAGVSGSRDEPRLRGVPAASNGTGAGG